MEKKASSGERVTILSEYRNHLSSFDRLDNATDVCERILYHFLSYERLSFHNSFELSQEREGLSIVPTLAEGFHTCSFGVRSG